MSFTWKADRPLLSEEEIARRVHAVSLKRELDELATVMALMCIRQESAFWCPANENDPSSKNYPHDSLSDDGRSVAYFQQQNGAPGEVAPPGQDWWGPMSCRMNLECSANTFLERLADDYTSATDGAAAGRFIQRVQRSAYPDAYAKHWDYCWSLLHRALAGGVANPPVPPEVIVKPVPVTPPVNALKPNPGWRGDPHWLPEVLRAFGVDCYEVEGARERGHGDFGAISWVLWHHTGNVNETDDGIAHHPSLGLAANMLIHPDGRVAITGFGVAWHGGKGVWPGIPEDGINQVSIGIECAHSGAHGDPWPAAQMEAMLRVGAAIEWFLALPADHEIAHKEWAGAENILGINKQGKPDPIDIDMDWFRSEVAKRAAAGPSGQGEDDLMGVDVDRLNKAVDKILGGGSMPQAWDSRSIFARDGKGVDDTVGMLLHTDGNGHTAKVILGALIGFPEYVADVRRVAKDGPAKGSYAAEHYFDAAQEFARKLEPLCGKLADLLLGFPELVEAITGTTGSLTDAPVKKAPARKRPSKKAPQPEE
ncbi:lysin A [Mycobacterium phage PenguinLover67]|nr:lysin A [Mycobacterium phage PenguinLover67]